MGATVDTPEPVEDPGAPYAEKMPAAEAAARHAAFVAAAEDTPNRIPPFDPHRIHLPTAIEQLIEPYVDDPEDLTERRDMILAIVHAWYSETDTDRRRREDARTAADRLHPLVDHVWCLTCAHTHIPAIPQVTFRCHAPLPEGHQTVPDGTSGCGFGVWSLTVAADHADAFPDHIVHPVHHQTVPAAP